MWRKEQWEEDDKVESSHGVSCFVPGTRLFVYALLCSETRPDIAQILFPTLCFFYLLYKLNKRKEVSN